MIRRILAAIASLHGLAVLPAHDVTRMEVRAAELERENSLLIVENAELRMRLARVDRRVA